MRLSNTQKAVIALFIANTIWGMASPIYKWSFQNIHPFTLAFLRFAIPAIILFPFVFKSLKIEHKDFLKVFLFAFTGITLNITFLFLGLEKTASINGPIIASSAPIFIILFSLLFLKEHLKIKTLLGTVIGFLGIMLIVIEPAIEKGLDQSVIGNMFLIISMFAAIIQILIGKDIVKRYRPLTLTYYAFAIGAVTFIPLELLEVSQYGFLTNLDFRGIIGIIFSAFGSSLIAYHFLHWSLKYLPASRVGIFSYIDPISGVLIAMPLLGEIPSELYIVGALLVFLGIYIAEGRIHFHPLHLFKRIEQKAQDRLP